LVVLRLAASRPVRADSVETRRNSVGCRRLLALPPALQQPPRVQRNKQERAELTESSTLPMAVVDENAKTWFLSIV
jgi:hypothetical protein